MSWSSLVAISAFETIVKISCAHLVRAYTNRIAELGPAFPTFWRQPSGFAPLMIRLSSWKHP
jgi:hypothetical protein